MAGLWELPGNEIAADEDGKDRLFEVLKDRVGLSTQQHESVGRIHNLFTHRRLTLEVFRCVPEKGARVRLNGYVAHEWVRPARLLELAMPAQREKRSCCLESPTKPPPVPPDGPDDDPDDEEQDGGAKNSFADLIGDVRPLKNSAKTAQSPVPSPTAPNMIGRARRDGTSSTSSTSNFAGPIPQKSVWPAPRA